jgi:hypothetical protein
MAWTTPSTWVQNAILTYTQLNQQLRDNLNAIWVGTTLGDIEYYSSATAKTKIPIGTLHQSLKVVAGIPTWSNETGVILRTATAQSIANNTLTDIAAWTSEGTGDPDGFHVADAAGIVIPAGMTGNYEVGVTGYWDANATAAKLREVYINKNGTAYYGQSAANNDANTSFHQNIVMVIYLEATDYVRVAVKQTSGGALNFTGTYFWCVRKM